MVVVAIIGVLAAVAIPAYNTYRGNARTSLVNGSLNNIIKAFNACLVSDGAFDTGTGECGNPNINMTLQAQTGATITSNKNTGGSVTTICFQVEADSAIANQEDIGCVQFDVNGNPTRKLDDTTNTGKCTTGSCG